MKLIVVLPGGIYSMGFFASWTMLVGAITNGIPQFGIDKVSFVNVYSPVVYQGRNAMLLAGQKATKDVQPFGGEYDYILWLETDMVFEPSDVLGLLAENVDSISALYPMSAKMPDVAVAGWWNAKGEQQRLKISAMLASEGRAVKADYHGLGFLLQKKGVLEKIGYPWFNELYEQRGDTYEYLGDDFSMCKQLKAKGVDLWVSTKVAVGHEKTMVARGGTNG